MSNSPTEQLRDDVQELKITVKKVIEPTLTDVSNDVKGLIKGGYISRNQADTLYAPKDDVKFLKTLVYSLIGAFITQFMILAFVIFKFVIGAK